MTKTRAPGFGLLRALWVVTLGFSLGWLVAPTVGERLWPTSSITSQPLAAVAIAEHTEPAQRRTPIVSRIQPRAAAAIALLAVAKEMGMPGSPIINPCLDDEGGACRRRALDGFFRSLDAVTATAGQSRITVFGNSLIVSDRIVDIWRARLQDRFGDGGRGFLLANRMAPYGSFARTGDNARGFVAHNVVWGERGPYPFGIAGALHVSKRPAQTNWALRGARHARVFWLDHPRATPFALRVDDEDAVLVRPSGTGGGRVTNLALASGARTLNLQTTGQGAVIYGVSLERVTPGVILDTLAVIGADGTRFLRTDPKLFAQQLRALAPDLVCVLLGGNEIKRIAWGGATRSRVKRDFRRFVRRLRHVSPDASCLVVGPLENVMGGQPTRKKNRRPVSAPFQTRPETYYVNALMRAAAVDEGCAFFDLFAAMGGPGALRKLAAADMLNADRIHPRGRGLDLVGELIHDAVLDAYERGTPSPQTPAAAPGPRLAGQKSDFTPSQR